MGRAPCCDKATVKRGPWSPEEDRTLRSYLEKNGTGGNWIALPQKAGLRRCGKSCRLRWLNYLRPDIKHGFFTEEEDNIICTLYRNIGSRWSVIVSHLPGRTDNDVKNYWNTKLKKRVMQATEASVTCTGTDFFCSSTSTNQEAASWQPPMPMPMPLPPPQPPMRTEFALEDGSSSSSSLENYFFPNADGSRDLFFSEASEFLLNGFGEVNPPPL